ncbi:hypothetical protein Pcinc_005193 [Petrolisthes cinctipes]|uniref:Uncharacterized protein n=1 Tax=Petrolisthes cinctipes TaxID=88211 RepID=A0AAE1GDA6_PETCI|nr:hypothetical protein Pcinc_005193 [Petrolisthes cinctipes]
MVNTNEDMREVFLVEHFIHQLPPNLKYELISHEMKAVMEAGREVTVGVKETLSIDGVDMFIGNDLAGKRVIPNLQMVEDPVKEMMENTTIVTVPNSTGEEKLVPEVFPVCAVTRAMAKMGITEPDEVMQEDQDLGVLFEEPCELENDQSNGNVEKVESQIELKIDMEIEKSELMREQEKDESLKFLWNEAKRSDELDENFVGYYVDRECGGSLRVIKVVAEACACREVRYMWVVSRPQVVLGIVVVWGCPGGQLLGYLVFYPRC